MIATTFMQNYFQLNAAEREGFEPSVPLPVRQFSKLFLSATQASLRSPINRSAINQGTKIDGFTVFDKRCPVKSFLNH
jgi:hypothetical protein